MGLKPAFRVVANANNITDVIAKRLISLQVVDEAGVQSDTCRIVLADHDDGARIAVPPTGAELDVSIGYDDNAVLIGKFVVDEIELSGPPDRLVITAKAAAHDTTPGGTVMVQTQKTRSFPAGTTLGDLTDTIAVDHNLTAAVAPAVAGIALPQIDQINESDMALITRVARNYDAVAKPAGGKLVVAPRGQAQSASGKTMPAVALRPADVSSWRVTIAKRMPPGTVVAIWHDLDAATDVDESTGSGDPVTRLRYVHPDQTSAQAAAQAELQRRQRGERQLDIRLPGNPDLVAEGQVSLAGFRDGVNGAWVIKQVTHTIDSTGYQSSARCELAN